MEFNKFSFSNADIAPIDIGVIDVYENPPTDNLGVEMMLYNMTDDDEYYQYFKHYDSKTIQDIEVSKIVVNNFIGGWYDL